MRNGHDTPYDRQQQQQQHPRRHDMLLYPTSRRRRLAATATTTSPWNLQVAHHHHQHQSLQERFFHHNDDYYYYYHPQQYAEEESKFMGIIPWTIRFIKICVLGMMMVVSSIICYGVFYWAVMPGSYASRPLFFDYTGTVPYPHGNVTHTVVVPSSPPPLSTKNCTSSNHQQQQQVTPVFSNNNNNDDDDDPSSSLLSSLSSSCSTTTPPPPTSSLYKYSPWATVDLFVPEQAVLWGMETLHQQVLPSPQQETTRILQPFQPYYVEVHLTLPETRHNREVGMFGISVDLLSSSSSNNDETTTLLRLASSVRPARLPHESPWVAAVRKAFWILPLIFGGMPETRVLIIPSFRHIRESEKYPLVCKHTVNKSSRKANSIRFRFWCIVPHLILVLVSYGCHYFFSLFV
jgi:Putative adipose-regulatory protein (Seipin)